MPSTRPPLAIAPYIRASARAVATPLAAGISLSSNGMSPCTSAFTPGKYIAPNTAENGSAATRGATRLKIGFCRRGLRSDDLRGAASARSTGGRPRCRPSVFSGAATSVRISSRIPLPVTARASPDSSQP